MKFFLKLILWSLFLALLVGAGGAYWAWQRYEQTPLVFPGGPVRVTVSKGASVRSISLDLRGKGVRTPTMLMVIAMRLRGDAGQIKSGVYQFEGPMTVKELLNKLVKGEVLFKDIRFIEGWTFAQMRKAVADHPDLSHDTGKLSDRELLERIGATEPHPEGLFFPSTYLFSPGSSDIEVYRQSYRLMKKNLEEAWAGRAEGLPLKSPYDLLVLASVVEKETGREADRDKVAAVFINRLKRGMMLQSDPTTIYGMGERFDGNLRKRDLQTDTPYNTYTRGGLPPTPIALPGRSSLLATTRPADIPALYFVARGDGTSEFSNDLAAHNRAVSRFQLGKAQ